MAAAPANAGYSYALHAGCDYASAKIWVNNGTWGRARAIHGSRDSGWSNWANVSASAWADAGYVCSSWAGVQHT